MDVSNTLNSIEQCRSRPAMYVGSLDANSAIATMLQETMCLAIDDCAHGCATEIRIERQRDQVLSVLHNGSSLDPTSMKNGKPIIELLLTSLYACRNHKSGTHDLCAVGIVAANALSQWFTIEFTHANRIWRQEFVRGIPKSKIHVVGETAQQWCKVCFLPDTSIFPDISLDVATFYGWFKEKVRLPPGCAATFLDGISGNLVDLLNV